eukprot:5120663-Prorocentrum_lima.AAC.1
MDASLMLTGMKHPSALKELPSPSRMACSPACARRSPRIAGQCIAPYAVSWGPKVRRTCTSTNTECSVALFSIWTAK